MKQGRNGGFVLVLVLVLMAALSFMIVRAQVSARTTLNAEESHLLNERLRHILTGSVLNSLRELANDENTSVDHLGEKWAVPRQYELPDETRVVVRVIDVNRFFDMNNMYLMATESPALSPERVLANIMTLCGDLAPQERVDALKEWVDPEHPGTREERYYMEQEPPYRPSRTWLASWREILLVQGFDPVYFERSPEDRMPGDLNADIIDQVSILPVRRTRPIPVNINTASREVMLGILGYEREPMVRYIIESREEIPFRSVEDLSAIAGMDVLRDVRAYLDVRSEFYTVEARAYSAVVTSSVMALARRGADGTIQVLRWVY